MYIIADSVKYESEMRKISQDTYGKHISNKKWW